MADVQMPAKELQNLRQEISAQHQSQTPTNNEQDLHDMPPAQHQQGAVDPKLQSPTPKLRHVDGGLFVDFTSPFIIVMSLFSVMLRVATIQKLIQDMPTTVENFVVQSLPSVILTGLAVLYAAMVDNLCPARHRVAVVGALMAVASSVTLFSYIRSSASGRPRQALLLSTAIILPLSALVTVGRLSFSMHLIFPHDRPWRLIAQSCFAIGVVDMAVYTGLLIVATTPRTCALIALGLDSTLLVLALCHLAKALAFENANLGQIQLSRLFLNLDGHYLAIRMRECATFPKLSMMVLSGAILALLTYSLSLVSYYGVGSSQVNGSTGILAMCCLAAIVLLTIGFLCIRREPLIVSALLHLNTPFSIRINRNEVEASEMMKLTMFGFLASSLFFAGLQLLNERVAFCGYSPFLALACLPATLIRLLWPIILFLCLRNNTTPTLRWGNNSYPAGSSTPSTFVHRLWSLGQPYIWWSLMSAIQAMNFIILGYVEQPPRSFFGWCYFSIGFMLSALLVRAACVITETPEYIFAIRLVPFLAFIWLGYSASAAALRILAFIFASTRTNQSSCLTLMLGFAFFAMISVWKGKGFEGQAKVKPMLGWDFARPVASNTSDHPAAKASSPSGDSNTDARLTHNSQPVSNGGDRTANGLENDYDKTLRRTQLAAVMITFKAERPGDLGLTCGEVIQVTSGPGSPTEIWTGSNDEGAAGFQHATYDF